jgi:hypothetical protein
MDALGLEVLVGFDGFGEDANFLEGTVSTEYLA